ncbi:T9SS type A sorting domain-containing protein [Flavobacterium sp. TSSA_36]|uniref:T9SS type A sorting domain-containing protein n=1 Tax=Flavobacterium sp. TSSA_36 TaxID=3447669 RepID=UPI003F3CA43B
MKKFTSLIFLMFFALGFSQNNPVTFETGGQGANWTFSNFDNGPSPTIGFEKVQNPFKTGVNTSETVGKFTALAGKDLGGSGAGCQSKHGVDLGTFKLSYANSTLKIMVYKTVKSPVGIKFAEADGGSNGELTVTNTKINEWEELTFDFTSRIGATKSGAIDQLILFMDLTENRPEATVSYFDNITFSKSLAAPPVVACNAILKDALEGTFADGYKVKFETVGTNVNITFELLDQKDGLVAFLHRESPFEETQMTNKAGTRIFTQTITGQTPGEIISYACKFAYAGGLSKTKYIKYEVGSFCDGIKPTAPTAAAPTPTATAPNVISLFSGGAYTDLAGTNWNPNWGQTTVFEEVSIAGYATKKYTNFNYQGVVLQTPVDISNMTKLHLDVWSPDCTALKVFLVPTTGAEKSITVNPTLFGWNSFDITLADYTNVDLKSIKELKFESVTAGTTVFLDNIYFVKAVDPSLSMNAPVTFETGDHGAGWKFTNFENGAGPEGFEKVANPSVSGINTSATVGKYTATVDGGINAGCQTNDIGKFTFDTKNSTVKMMVYKTVISDVSMKFAVADGGSLGEIKVKNTKINEWEELTFDFYNQIGKVQSTDIVTMIISLDNRVRTSQNSSYFDNITFSKTTVASPVQICDAVLKEASQGAFTTGYKANFATVGTDVNITFELLDAKDGLVVGLWKESPFTETPMVNTPAGSKIFTAKLTNQKVGDLISYACKFAYAGGQSVTKYIKYEVGTACTGTTPPPVVTGPTLPLDFETGTFAFTDFDGGAVTVVDNPSKTGINTSAKVAKMVKGAGAIWAGSYLKMASPIDFTTNKKVKVKVWSPVAGKKLLLKFEGAGAAFEKEVATTAANTWEELTFDYTGVAGVNNLNDKIVLIFDLGTAGDGSAASTYYFDEITQATTPPVVTGPTLPLDFETGTFAFTDFDGGAVTVVDNPSKTGINTSAKVAKMIKGAGAIWAGSYLKMASPIDFTTNKKVKVKVWSPVAGKKLLLKFEGAGAAFEKEVATTAANTWEELTFDYTGVAGVNNLNDKIVLIFDLGTAGDGSAASTYYFDEITQATTPPVVTGPTLPLDFETGTFAFTDFDGGAVTIVDNPSKTGINTSAKVAKMVKGAGAIWAGSYLKMASPIDFTTNKKVKVKVWSPVAGKKLLLKFEGAGAAFEKEVATTAANTWEELTFDYTGVAGVNNLNDKIVLIFDLGTAGDGSAASTYYFDEITQAATPPVVTGPTLPLDFETGTFAFTDFDGGAVTVVDNPSKTGINTSGKVAKMVKGAGQPWGGSKLTLATPVDFSTKKIVKVKVWSPVAGKKLLLKFESPNGNFEKESVGVTAANTWEELTFDFTNVSTTNTASDIVFIFDLGTSGDGSANSTYYFDEITQSAGSVPVTGATLPLDFEATTYAFVDFDGGVTTKVANPQKNGINTSANVAKMVKGAGAMWAGSKIKMAAPIDFSTNKLFKVKVWSPVAGKKLLLKFEGTAGNFEQESTGVTTANTWEELTFDFTKVATNNVADFMVFIFDLGTVGDGSANSTYYFDDVQQASMPVVPSANYHVSFEQGTVIGTWNAFENPGQTGFEFADNPSKTGINTSNKVGKFTAVAAGQPWAGCETASGTIGTWELDATSKTVTMMVYKSDISPVGIKMATSYNGTTFEIKKKNTKINEWELMTFDISSFITSADATKINKFVVFPDFRSDADPVRNKDVVFYFDDIKFSAKKLFDPNYVAPPVDNPTVAAPTPPTRNAADVKSIFSDVYTVYKAGNWCQCWGQSTVVSEVKVVGDTTRKLENFTYQGVTLPDGEVFNVLDMNKVHIDLWFNDAKSVSLALVQQTPGGSVEAALKFTPTKEGWNSFDLDLNATTLPGVDLSKVFQMKLTSEKQGSNVFLDNLYFWKDAATALAQMDLPVSFDDAKVDYSLLGFGGTEGSSIVVDPTLATNKVAKVLKPAISETWAGVTISAGAGLGFKNKIPFSTAATKMSVRVWSPDAGTIIRLKVEDHADKNRTVETESTVTTAKGWETVVFDFAKPVSGTPAMNLAYTYDKATIFFGFGSNGTEKIYYFDDVKMVEVALKPDLSFGVAAQTYPKGKSIFPLQVVNNGGVVPAKGYSIAPELPAGLSFDTTSGTISGVPTAVSLPKLYTITGTNTSGSATTAITINVVDEIVPSNFTIQTISESCLGMNNGEIRMKSADSRTYVVTVNGKSYDLTTSLRIFDLAPGTYLIKITVKGETTSQEFIAEIAKGGTISLKTNKISNDKLQVEMIEGTAPFKVLLNGVEQFETPFSVFDVTTKTGGLLEIVTAKSCEGVYSTRIEGMLEVFAAFPNPTSGNFEIAIPTERKEVVVELYSFNGLLVSSKSYPVENGSVQLNLNGQSNGVYLAKVIVDTPSYLKIIKK